jgi:hypothetical protein
MIFFNLIYMERYIPKAVSDARAHITNMPL